MFCQNTSSQANKTWLFGTLSTAARESLAAQAELMTIEGELEA